jgi:hypothetical protein
VERGGVGFGKLVEHAFGHHGIRVDALVGFEALLLNPAGGNDSLADDCRRLAGLHLRELGALELCSLATERTQEGHSLDLAVYADAVEDYVTPFHTRIMTHFHFKLFLR